MVDTLDILGTSFQVNTTETGNVMGRSFWFNQDAAVERIHAGAIHEELRHRRRTHLGEVCLSWDEPHGRAG